MTGASWHAGRVLLKASEGIPLEPDELLVFQRHTGRTAAPSTRPRELWEAAGRRSGKSFRAALKGVHAACCRRYTYVASEAAKSELYVRLVPLVNTGKVALLDLPVLVAQACGLERRVARGTGQETVDHGPHAHDDLINAVAGVLVLAAGGVPGDSWIAFIKSEVIRTGAPLPDCATEADRQAAGRRTVVRRLKPTSAAPAPPAPVTAHLGPLLAASHPAPPVNRLHSCGKCGHGVIGAPPPTCPNCGSPP